MKRKIAVLVLVLILAVSFAAIVGHADDGKKHHEYGKARHGKAMEHHNNLEEKFVFKAHFMLKNQEELGLSENQVKQIKRLKASVKKDMINKQAGIDSLAVDIKTEMWEDPLNLNAINKLIEKKYEIKKEKAKSLVAAISTLKGVLTDEQKKKLKNLYKLKKD